MESLASSPPHDTYNFTFTVFLLLGLAMSVPYSTVMNATKTFERRLDTAFFSHFSAVYLTAKFLFMVCAMIWLSCRGQMHKVTSVAVSALAAISLVLLMIAGWEGLAGDALYPVMLVTALVTSITSAFMEAGAYRLAGAFPPHILQALFIGSSCAGTLTSTISFILTFWFGEDRSDRLFTWLNFGIAFAIVAGAAIMWSQCQRAEYYRFYAGRLEKGGQVERRDEKQHERLIDILLRVGDLAAFVFISGIVSMVIWPFIPANTLSVVEGLPGAAWWQGRMFRPLAFLVSAIGGLIGKLLPSMPIFYRPHLPFLALAVARLSLILFYMMGNVRLRGRTMLVRPLLANDAFYFILTAASSIAGGYTVTLATMCAPDRVEPADRGTVTSIMAFFAYYGDLVGTLLSTVVAVLMKTVLSVPVVAGPDTATAVATTVVVAT